MGFITIILLLLHTHCTNLFNRVFLHFLSDIKKQQSSKLKITQVYSLVNVLLESFKIVMYVAFAGVLSACACLI